jgi:hypothetical protein
MDNPDQYAGINTKGTPEQALEFAGSPRGNLILSQALYYGIKALEAVEPEYMQEKSNIADMRFLQNAFVIPPEMFDNVAMAAMRDELIRFDSESA